MAISINGATADMHDWFTPADSYPLCADSSQASISSISIKIPLFLDCFETPVAWKENVAAASSETFAGAAVLGPMQ